MNTEPNPTDLLRARAKRGVPRGAVTVLDAAREEAAHGLAATPAPNGAGHRWAVTAVAAALVLVAAAGAFAMARTDGSSGPSASVPADGPCTDLIVYLNPGVTPMDRDAIAQLLAGDPRVARVTYVDRDETYANFRKLFAGEPAMLDNVRSEDLPTSFRVESAVPDMPASLEALETEARQQLPVYEARSMPTALRCDPSTIPVFKDGNEHRVATTEPAGGS